MNNNLLKIVQSVMANQIAYHFNHEIRFTNYYKHSLKNKLNQLDKELLKIEAKKFEKFFETAEIETTLLIDIQTNLIKKLSLVGVENFGEILGMIKAYEKNPKSMIGITKKILNI